MESMQCYEVAAFSASRAEQCARQPNSLLANFVSMCQPTNTSSKLFQGVHHMRVPDESRLQGGARPALNPIDFHPGYCGSNIIFRPCHQWHCTQLRCCNVYLSAQSSAHCYMLQFVIKNVGHK